MRAYWDETGPPPNVALRLVAEVLGVKFDRKDPTEALEQALGPGAGPSIAELAGQIQPPLPGGDTLAASRELMRLMASEGSA